MMYNVKLLKKLLIGLVSLIHILIVTIISSKASVDKAFDRKLIFNIF